MNKCVSIATGLALAAGSAATTIAQETPEEPVQIPQFSKTYCEDNDGFKEWDFWVGDWNVYTNNEARQFAGTNSITKHYANCLIKETWVDATGNGGFSINYFNPVRDEWRQVWVANAYSIDYTGGLNDQGQMVLEGHIDNYQQGVSQGFRGTWTPTDSGDVIQRFEVLNPETDNWDLWFEGRYVNQATDPNPPQKD